MAEDTSKKGPDGPTEGAPATRTRDPGQVLPAAGQSGEKTAPAVETEVFHTGVLEQEEAEKTGKTKVVTPDFGTKYRSGEWAGIPRYACPHCSYTTVTKPDALIGGDAVIED